MYGYGHCTARHMWGVKRATGTPISYPTKIMDVMPVTTSDLAISCSTPGLDCRSDSAWIGAARGAGDATKACSHGTNELIRIWIDDNETCTKRVLEFLELMLRSVATCRPCRPSSCSLFSSDHAQAQSEPGTQSLLRWQLPHLQPASSHCSPQDQAGKCGKTAGKWAKMSK